MKITNMFGEELDVEVEGNPKSDKVIIFVHGFGTDKNEGFSSFLDEAEFFNDQYITVRFDQSGYGKSQGNDYEFQFQKAAGDLDSVIRWVRRNTPNKMVYISAHSLGAFVTAILSPYQIKKIAMTSIPNSDTDYVIRTLQKRITANGGQVREDSLTQYLRTSGATQVIGKDFWRTLRAFKPVESLKELGDKSDVLILKPMQDEVLDDKYFDEYKTIENIEYIEVDGDHNFKKPDERKAVFELIKVFFSK